MKKGKVSGFGKGPGFGDAMFAIKDMQMDYASFNQDSPPALSSLPPPTIPKKNPIAAKTQPKPVLQLKPTATTTKPKTLQQHQ
jgi:hypothetical protein